MHRTTSATRTTLTAAALTAAVVAVITALPISAQTDTTSPEQLPEPVVSTHDLMELFNKPLYMQLKKAMSETPSSDQQWNTVTERGWQAAEVANLVAIRDTDHPAETWKSLAYNLQRRGVELAKAAKAKDVEKTKQAYASLIESCNTCHNQLASGHAPKLKK